MLDVRDIDVFYGLVPALHQVRLEVAAGETVCLLGPNGAGKTTTVKSIIGLLKPRAGTIRWDGADITGLPPHVTVGLGLALAPEGRLLFPDMSVEENLELGASPARARPETRQTQEWVYTLFPRLRARRRQAAGTMSGGEQQMLAIGRCLMGQPRLIMFDEPSLGLAPAIVQEVFRIVRRLNEEGLTILLIEHVMRAVMALAAEVVVVSYGEKIAEGTPAEIARHQAVLDVYLGEEEVA